MDCAAAAEICQKAAYREASSKEKLKLKLHLFFCDSCKKYHERNQKLTHLLKKSKIHICSSSEKEAYKRKMEEEKLEAHKDQKH